MRGLNGLRGYLDAEEGLNIHDERLSNLGKKGWLTRCLGVLS